MEIKKGEKKSILERMHFSPATIGEVASDKLSMWAGSWGFILSFIFLLILWMIVNIYAYVQVWDPYPFILLNLVLSCLAALQAPIILMSQNRLSKKDRQKAEYDYLVNRRSERKIENIEKVLARVERKMESGKR